MSALTDARVQQWLVNFHVPERLADPAMRALLAARGRRSEGSPMAVAREAGELFREKIGNLAPGPDAPREAWRPFVILTVSYLHRTSVWATAIRLGMSERTVSRERARAIRLLRAELEELPTREGTGVPGPFGSR